MKFHGWLAVVQVSPLCQTTTAKDVLPSLYFSSLCMAGKGVGAKQGHLGIAFIVLQWFHWAGVAKHPLWAQHSTGITPGGQCCTRPVPECSPLLSQQISEFLLQRSQFLLWKKERIEMCCFLCRSLHCCWPGVNVPKQWGSSLKDMLCSLGHKLYQKGKSRFRLVCQCSLHVVHDESK